MLDPSRALDLRLSAITSNELLEENRLAAHSKFLSLTRRPVIEFCLRQKVPPPVLPYAKVSPRCGDKKDLITTPDKFTSATHCPKQLSAHHRLHAMEK